jgi:hypothetical protein
MPSRAFSRQVRGLRVGLLVGLALLVLLALGLSLAARVLLRSALALESCSCGMKKKLLV